MWQLKLSDISLKRITSRCLGSLSDMKVELKNEFEAIDLGFK
jgi:hypothetical protein